MRPILGPLHKWAGLFIAVFLIFSGITGAIISWDHELDDWLNPELHDAKTQGVARSSFDLAKLIEARDPRARVTYMTMAPEKAGESQSFFITPRIDPATNKKFELGYNQIFLDPVTGDELGRREWGAVWPITKQNFVSFLYRLHYTLHLPTMFGIDRWGLWLFGVIAMIWTVDCFVGFYLTLPPRKKANAARPAAVDRELSKGFWSRWAPAWKIKTSGSAYRINFDIHRAFGLWTWALLFIVAFTGFSLNLYMEIFSPVMRMVSNYTPTPYELRTALPLNQQVSPTLSFEEIHKIAEAEGKRRGWDVPVGAISYATQYGIYNPRYFKAGDDHGVGGVGPARLYWDADGTYLGERLPWKGTAADIFVQAQFPLHSGRILGLPGRILISIMGIVVAALSVTGIVIWLRKRRARLKAKVKAEVQGRAGSLMPAE
jgi:uncharacterized iron-regulated membrane protein